MKMKIKAEHQDNFTVIDNGIFADKRLPLKARGMLATLLSLPDNWEFNENGLEKMFCDGLTAIKSSLKKLEETGYLVKKQARDENGKFTKNEWIIYEKPSTKSPISENDTQLNTNKLNTNKEKIYSPSDDERDSSSLSEEQELTKNFNLIWKNYPRKDGKNKAFQHYKAWLKGRKFVGETKKFTNKEMYWAVKIYAYECDRDKKEKQYIQMGSTFFNDTIESRVNRYNAYPEDWEKQIREWENFKNENL